MVAFKTNMQRDFTSSIALWLFQTLYTTVQEIGLIKAGAVGFGFATRLLRIFIGGGQTWLWRIHVTANADKKRETWQIRIDYKK
jgi:ketosteroid isomerase-like protein